MNNTHNIKPGKQLYQCDFIRTALMLFVALGHSVDLWMGDWFNQPPVNECVALEVVALWINSFHTYAFVLLSGYLFYYLKFENHKYQNYWRFVKNKFHRLIVPYLFVSAVWVAPVYAYFYHADILSLFRKFILCEGPSQLWFLIMLFGVFVLAFPLSKLFDHRPISISVLIVGLFGVSLIGDVLFPNYFQIWKVLEYLTFFFIGVGLRRLEYKNRNVRISIGLLTLLDIILFIGYVLVRNYEGIIYRFLYYGIAYLLHIVGAVGAFYIIWKISERIDLNNKVYITLQKCSMGIFLFHQQIIYFVIDTFNGVLHPFILAGLSFGVSIVVSIGITNIFLKNRKCRKLIGC